VPTNSVRNTEDRQAEIFRLIDEGFTALEAGQLEAAGRSAAQLLELEPGQVDALYLSGRIEQRRERLDLAQDYYERAILAKGDFIDPYIKLIEILMTSAQAHAALRVCRLALSRIKPSLDHLVDLCGPLVEDFPEEMKALLKPGLARGNTNSRVWTTYQDVLHRLCIDGAEYDAFLDEMRDLFPGTLQVEIAEAAALAHRNRLDEALAATRLLAQKHPELVAFEFMQGRIHRVLRQYEAAQAKTEMLVRGFPDNADYAFMLSDIKLCKGEIGEGLRLNEDRFKRARGFNWAYLPMPNWRGEPLAGKRLLVIEEQGFGDCIMFGRYLSRLAERGAQVRCVCRPALYPMFAAQPSLRHVEILQYSEHLRLPPDMDYYISTMSVALRLDIDTAGAGTGACYLAPDPARVAAWREKLPRDGRPLIGVVWAGNLGTPFGQEKSLPSAQAAQLLDNPEFAFVSLQMPAELNEPHRHLLKHIPEIGDFNDTMSIIACLDAVVCVDTSVAHLAASMGQRTIVLSKFAPDWRWEGAGQESGGQGDVKPYWYPDVVVLRQDAPRDWSGPLARLPALLREMPRS
jgi:tetratricopeptide (TPR) repeat protein